MLLWFLQVLCQNYEKKSVQVDYKIAILSDACIRFFARMEDLRNLSSWDIIFCQLLDWTEEAPC